MCDVKSTSDDGVSAGGSTSEGTRSKVGVQTTTSQRSPVVGEYKSVSTSTDERENRQLPAGVEETEVERSKRIQVKTFGSFGGRKQINAEVTFSPYNSNILSSILQTSTETVGGGAS